MARYRAFIFDHYNGIFTRRAVHEELHTHVPVHTQDAESTKEEWYSTAYPFQAIVPIRISPATASVGREIGPGVGVCHDGCGVEEVSAEGGCEEKRREPSCAFPAVVLVELRRTRTEV